VIVCGNSPTAFTVKLCVTGVAAAYVALPACVAWMVHAPAARKVAVVPLTVHAPVVCELKLTVSPELAVAASVSGVPTVCVPGFANVIVCAFPLTATFCTALAGSYWLLPACVASSVQVPAAIIVAVFPLTVQIENVFDAKVTGSPELAVAESVAVVPTVW
jgi:hypothetical protein